MGRLFWKLFFAFWLSLIAVAFGVGVAVWIHRDNAPQETLAVAVGGPPTLVVRSGAAVLAAAGVEPLRELLQEWEGPFPLYVVDAAGNELLGRPITPATVADAGYLADSADPRRAARRVVLASGDSYLLFVPIGEAAAAAAVLPPPPPGSGGLERAGPPLPPVGGHHHPPGGPLSPWLPLVIGLVASLLFSALLAWYLTRPVRHLRHAFDAAAAGDLALRVEPLLGRRRDEIADLGREYDRMATRLQALIGAQRRLFHDVSHELRSPLARMQAAIGLAHQAPGQQGAAIERIEQEAGRLDQLVGELLTLARLESKTEGMPPEEVDLFALAEEVAADAQYEAQAYGGEVRYSGSGRATLWGRQELLARAMENVVRNAVKYAVAGGPIQMEAELAAEGRAFCLRVSDRGPGVGEAELSLIFDPFFRSAGGGDGYGLGLAIARRAVEAHGGEITARQRPGGGLQVEIRLPLAVDGA